MLRPMSACCRVCALPPAHVYVFLYVCCRELQRLDEGLRSVNAEASDLSTRPPQGLPPRHWWYACKGQMAGSIC